eukprot:TRINITY_DN8702_c0_g2_i1.p2 TRINITY_DN8702_c0_g2~~TRINITY_DN8702_c0_g2_i1.p2  ORF type:complete len:405 (+),score=60.59 TRINITY_DN8702_c0_g2_i1:530-1744(+)
MRVSIHLALAIFMIVCQITVQRPDETQEIAPYDGIWGDWGSWKMCPDGYYATGFAIQVEGKQGGGDDTAMNRFKMGCRSLYNQVSHVYTQTSGSAGNWGSWGNYVSVSGGNFLDGAGIKFEKSQGGGDDTAMNSINMRALDGSWHQPKNAGPWGDWKGYAYCPTAQVICGVRARLEGHIGRGDDTALNSLRFKCCTLLKFELQQMKFDPVNTVDIVTKPQTLGSKIIANPSSAIVSSMVTISQEFQKSFTYSFSETLGISQTMEVSVGIPDIMASSQSFTISSSFERGTSTQHTETVTYSAQQEVQAQPYSCIETIGSIYFSTDDVKFPFTAIFKIAASSGDSRIVRSVVEQILRQNGFSGSVIQVASSYMLVSIRGDLTAGLAYRTSSYSKDLEPTDPKCQAP